VEIIRFGPGHRRAEGPVGSRGVADRVIWGAEGAHVTELAFSRRAVVAPQTSPDLALFIVISGGGWVQVGEERAAVNHGEAVVWPPGAVHGAWTDGSEMRALLLELPEPPPGGGRARSSDVGGGADAGGVTRGALAPRDVGPDEHDRSSGEPW
jgi:quercetin dioxygenase-like cupin family protein